MNQPAQSLTDPVTLATLRKGERGVVVEVLDRDVAAVGDVADSTICRRLIEIGFVAGEPVEIVAAAWPGGDPLAVRIGASVFALRRREALAVLIRPVRDAAVA
jgi:ferrous iron transport protein A